MSKKIFCAGCSFTKFSWPMWPEILNHVLKDTEVINLGQPGASNPFILSQLLTIKEQYTDDDLVIVMWSKPSRKTRAMPGDIGKLIFHNGSSGIKNDEINELYLDTLTAVASANAIFPNIINLGWSISSEIFDEDILKYMDKIFIPKDLIGETDNVLYKKHYIERGKFHPTPYMNALFVEDTFKHLFTDNQRSRFMLLKNKLQKIEDDVLNNPDIDNEVQMCMKLNEPLNELGLPGPAGFFIQEHESYNEFKCRLEGLVERFTK